MLDNFINEALVIDTETTGLNPEKDEIIELAACRIDTKETRASLFGCKNPIPFESSAVNNISRHMVAGKPQCINSQEIVREILFDYAPTYYIAHNVSFDRKILKFTSERGGFDIPHIKDDEKWICTHKLAKYIMRNEDIKSFSQQYLRYWFDLDSQVTLGNAHRADADVVICSQLLLNLINMGMENGDIDPSKDIGLQLYEITTRKKPITKWPYGKKHKNKLLTDLSQDFIFWALDNIEELDEESEKFRSELFEAVKKELESRIVE